MILRTKRRYWFLINYLKSESKSSADYNNVQLVHTLEKEPGKVIKLTSGALQDITHKSAGVAGQTATTGLLVLPRL